VDHSDALVLDATSSSTGVNTQYPRQKQEGALQSKILKGNKAPYNPVQQLEEARFKKVDQQKQS
jgi:hypothetical protein